jgi:hypothetical protein
MVGRTEKRKTEIITDGDSRGYQRSTKAAGKANDFLVSSLKKVTNIATAVFVGLSAAVGVAIKAFDEQIRAERKLRNALQNSGREVEKNTAYLKEQAAALQRVTDIGDETTLALQSLIAPVKSLTVQGIQRATKAAIDMATALDKGLTRTTRLLAQALEAPIAGLTTLRTNGIEFTEEQKDLIKQLVNTNRTFEAQSIILKKIEDRYGRVSEKLAKTPLAVVQRVKNEFGDILEIVGDVASEALVPFLLRLKDMLQSWKENEGAIRRVTEITLDLIKFLGVFLTLALGARGIVAVTAAVNLLAVAFRTGRVAASAFWGSATLGASLLITEFDTINGAIEHLISRFKVATKESKGVVDPRGGGRLTPEEQLAAFRGSQQPEVEEEEAGAASGSGGVQPVNRETPQPSGELQIDGSAGLSDPNSTAAFRAANESKTEAEVEYREKLKEIRQEADDAERERREKEEEEVKEHNATLFQRAVDFGKRLADLRQKRIEEEKRAEEALRDFKIKAASDAATGAARVFRSALLHQVATLIKAVPALFVAQGAATGGIFGLFATLAKVAAVVEPLRTIHDILSSESPKFHEGGTVRAAKTGGEVTATLQDGETVFSRGDTHKLINRLSDKLERGGGGGVLRVLIGVEDEEGMVRYLRGKLAEDTEEKDLIT